MANDNIDYASAEPTRSSSGPFLAKVISHLIPSYMGVLEVELLRPVGNDSTSGQLHQVKMMSPFWGSTSVDYVNESANDYNTTQKSYGMWFVPPDPGTTVMVIFIDGDPKRGYWIGCIPDENMNFMVPGIAATEQVVEGGGRLPVAEYNKKANPQIPDATKIKKPKHPLAKVLEQQVNGQGGLLLDDIRGITTSSARRELPSAVFGISTPGPRDKTTGATQGNVGAKDSQIKTFVSRLGGTTFVMDDGDDKFLRKKPASGATAGPPEYVSVEQGETGGDVKIPHNELVRIRTRTGHQILLHNSEDLIYIGNGSGTTWIELTGNGKIDIYAKDSISIHTNQDLNFTADRDINFTAGRDINLSAGRELLATATTNYHIRAAQNGNLYCGQASSIRAGTTHAETAGQIYMNSSTAAATAKIAPVTSRRPDMEPWNGHENLDPASFLPARTVAVAPGTRPPAAPAKYKKYTTATDTFKQERPANGKT